MLNCVKIKNLYKKNVKTKNKENYSQKVKKLITKNERFKFVKRKIFNKLIVFNKKI